MGEERREGRCKDTGDVQMIREAITDANWGGNNGRRCECVAEKEDKRE